MPWYNWFVSERMKKSICAYLIQRYLGQFFEEKLTSDQLSVDLYNGTGSVEKISLDVQALNELSEKQNWPLEFVDGFINKLQISIPWTTILKEPSFVEVDGLKITVQPKQRNEYAESMFESMWNSMTSSLKLAEEYAKEESHNVSSNEEASYEGLELFAQAIDAVLSRVKVKFVNTIIQLEHVPKDSLTGVGIVINIDLIQYFDEAGNEPQKEENNVEQQQQDVENSKKAIVVQTFTTKNIIFEGVTVSTIEFPSKARTFSRSMMSDNDDDDTDISLSFDEENNRGRDEKVRSETSGAPPGGKLPDYENLRYKVLFAKFANRQTIRLRTKQSEDSTAPKISCEVEFSHLLLFLTPRQVHLLLELGAGLACPDVEDRSNVQRRRQQRSRCVERPMTALDYQRVEQELQQQMRAQYAHVVPGLQAVRGWSGAPLGDESESEELIFYPMRNSASEMYDSAMSGMSGSLESSLSSSAPSTIYTDNTFRSRRRPKGYNNSSDPTAELSYFKIEFATVAVVLLHEDLLNLSYEGTTFVSSSVLQMQKTVDRFFGDVEDSGILREAQLDFRATSLRLNEFCKLNHLRLLAVPLQLEVNERTTNSSFTISVNLQTPKLEILECLVEKSNGNVGNVPLVVFDEQSSVSKPAMMLNFKHTERNVKSVRTKNSSKKELGIRLGKCNIEFDISIIDRITSLLSAPTLCVRLKRDDVENAWLPDRTPEKVKDDHQMSLKIGTSCLNLKIRFPIPDLRPAHDVNKTPWWKRNVRPDHLILKCAHAHLETSSTDSGSAYEEFTFRCRGADVYYNETEEGTPIHVARAGVDERVVGGEVNMCPRVTVKFSSVPDKVEEVATKADPMTQSCANIFYNPSDNGPFTSIIHQVHRSSVPHDSQPDEVEDMVVPGTREEIEEFKRVTVENAGILIDIALPNLKMQLTSKHIYELIYNRINNDLLIWESSAPKIKTKQASFYDFYGNLGHEASQEIFSACRSGVQYESDSGSEDASEGDGAILFYSTYEKPKTAAPDNVGAQEPPQLGAQDVNTDAIGAEVGADKRSHLVVRLNVAEGRLTWNAPVRDLGAGHVIPEHVGDFLLRAENSTVFFVNGYKGDGGLGYVSVQLGQAQLKHCVMMPSANINVNFMKDNKNGDGAPHLQPTIYKSEKGALADLQTTPSNRDMVTLACKIETKHETHHAKTICVALGLDRATLRHRVNERPNAWLTQILDFFNVTDYPIIGYKTKEAITELHLHVWNCAIDYRPLYLPLRALLTLGSFSLTSHLSEKSESSTLRLIAEECELFLSDKAPPRDGVASEAPVNLKRDYVNVISIGWFELSLKTTDKNSKNHPHMDMRAMNDRVHIYTCSDSGRALTQLITYVATDGDIRTNEENAQSTADSAYSSPRHQPTDQELVRVERPPGEEVHVISKLTQSQHQRMSEMISEALRESDPEPEQETQQRECPKEDYSGAKLFYFPGEDGTSLPTNANYKPIPQVSRELGDISAQHFKDDDSDDDFFIIDKDVGFGLYPRDGVPEIKWLTDDTVRIQENHFFVPVGKKDLLKTPDDFPTPVYKYMMCEMNLVWHMYGGNDFDSTAPAPSSDSNGAGAVKAPAERRVEFSDRRARIVGNDDDDERGSEEKEGVATSRRGRLKRSEMPWRVRGGARRDHAVLMELDLHKVKFLHEVYPEETVQASRQVLLVTELEIRDVLASSEFNKFLYQYTSEARPQQSQGHMIVIRAVHIRPDKNTTAQECCLRLSLLPLRFNIDQDSLKFLVTFFGELAQQPAQDGEMALNSPSKQQNTPTHQPPIMTVDTGGEYKKKSTRQKLKEREVAAPLSSGDLIDFDPCHFEEKATDVEDKPVVANANGPVFFRNFSFGPELFIKIDYQGKRVEMADGSLSSLLIGLVIGLVQLNCSELRLKSLTYRFGLLGVEKLVAFMVQEWLNDIKKNQLTSLLSGVGPIHSLVQLFQGIKDLFWMPIEQYQKDGRIVRGIQRGANSFTTSTAMAALELTSRLIQLIQLTAETAYDMLSPGPSVRKAIKPKGRKKKYKQPQDIREGVANAYLLVRQGIGETAGTFVEAASQEHRQKGYTGAVGGVLRQIPPTILRPIIIASEATSNVLGGMKSQLVPDARNEANQKWRNEET